MAESLTIAYVAIGARAALAEAQEVNPSLNLDRFNGEMGYIDQVIEWADLLDGLAEGRDLEGVFAYEVAQAFGQQFGARLLASTTPREVANAIAEQLIGSITAPTEETTA